MYNIMRYFIIDKTICYIFSFISLIFFNISSAAFALSLSFRPSIVRNSDYCIFPFSSSEFPQLLSQSRDAGHVQLQKNRKMSAFEEAERYMMWVMLTKGFLSKRKNEETPNPRRSQ